MDRIGDLVKSVGDEKHSLLLYDRVQNSWQPISWDLITKYMLSRGLRNKMSYEIFVGTYTRNNSKSKGIHQFNFDVETGASTLKQIIVSENPSFICLYKNNIYATNEVGDLKGGLTIFQFNEESQSLDNEGVVSSLIGKKAYTGSVCVLIR